MTTLVNRLAEPHNLRRLLLAVIALVTLALILAAVAIIRELRTAERVAQVDDRVTFIEAPSQPTKAQTRRALDRAIGSLTIPQRRKLLDRLLGAATLEQLKRIRQRAKVVTRRRARQQAARPPQRPVVRRSPARGRVPRPKPPAPPPPVVIPAPAPPPLPVLPAPALTPTAPDGPGKHGRGKAKGHAKK